MENAFETVFFIHFSKIIQNSNYSIPFGAFQFFESHFDSTIQINSKQKWKCICHWWRSDCAANVLTLCVYNIKCILCIYGYRHTHTHTHTYQWHKYMFIDPAWTIAHMWPYVHKAAYLLIDPFDFLFGAKFCFFLSFITFEVFQFKWTD